MPHSPPTLARRLLPWLTALLILKVTAAVVWGYRNYFPPNFSSDFLRGRDAEFWNGYHWAFYAHIVSGPLSLLLGLTLLNGAFLRRFPAWHRRLGRTQAACVLLFVAPSGLWMAWYTRSGPAAALSFAALALATAACIALGWRAAVMRRFSVHRRWMQRTFTLLCSAVILRLMGGLATVAGVEASWFDPLASWLCWLLPLAALELSRRRRQAPLSQPPVRTAEQPVPAMGS